MLILSSIETYELNGFALISEAKESEFLVKLWFKVVSF